MTYYSFFPHCQLTNIKEAFYTALFNAFVFIASHIAIATFVTVVAYGFEPEDNYTSRASDMMQRWAGLGSVYCLVDRMKNKASDVN